MGCAMGHRRAVVHVVGCTRDGSPRRAQQWVTDPRVSVGGMARSGSARPAAQPGIVRSRRDVTVAAWPPQPGAPWRRGTGTRSEASCREVDTPRTRGGDSVVRRADLFHVKHVRRWPGTGVTARRGWCAHPARSRRRPPGPLDGKDSGVARGLSSVRARGVGPRGSASANRWAANRHTDQRRSPGPRRWTGAACSIGLAAGPTRTTDGPGRTNDLWQPRRGRSTGAAGFSRRVRARVARTWGRSGSELRRVGQGAGGGSTAKRGRATPWRGAAAAPNGCERADRAGPEKGSCRATNGMILVSRGTARCADVDRPAHRAWPACPGST